MKLKSLSLVLIVIFTQNIKQLVAAPASPAIPAADPAAKAKAEAAAKAKAAAAAKSKDGAYTAADFLTERDMAELDLSDDGKEEVEKEKKRSRNEDDSDYEGSSASGDDSIAGGKDDGEGKPKQPVLDPIEQAKLAVKAEELKVRK